MKSQDAGPLEREELKKKLSDWTEGLITSEELGAWVTANYFPLHRAIGPNEQLHTQKAMHEILNMLELTVASDLDPRGGLCALDFLATEAEDFSRHKTAFLTSCYSTQLTLLESAILQKIVEGSPELIRISVAEVVRRETTGVGSYTYFKAMPGSSDVATPVGLSFLVTVPGVIHGLGAVLLRNDGSVHCLEIHTYGDERWNGSAETFQIG